MGWFVITKNSGGQFHFVLKAGNAETILTSEVYSSKTAAHTGIASVQANSGQDARYDRKVSTGGQPYFNLKALNGQVIGTSEMYSSTQARDAGIASVKVNGSTTTVKDLA